MADEQKPLLRGEQVPFSYAGGGYINTYGVDSIAGDSDAAPSIYPDTTTEEGSFASPIEYNELPPPYTPFASGIPMVTCRVCQGMIDIEGKSDQHVVKCGKCHEATPIKNAPPGKKYVRCPCNCLLICRSESQRIACPRPNCKRIINLKQGPDNSSSFPNVPGMCRVSCVHCRDTFIFNTLNNALARCPHCRKVSSVGPEYARNRGMIFVASSAAILFSLAILIGTTVKFTSQYPGIYVAYVGFSILLAALAYRSFYFCSMKISAIDGPL